MASAADLIRPTGRKRFDALRTRILVRRLAARALVGAIAVVAFSAGTFTNAGGGGFRSAPDTGSAAHGPTIAVPVATRDLAHGHLISEDDLTMQLVPANTILGRWPAEPLGRTVSSPIYEGELVSEARLADGGRFGLADGEVAVGVVPPLAPVPVAAGDIVALVAVGADALGGAEARALGEARVVAVDERVVTVAIPRALAPSLLEAQAVGTVELTLTPWSS